MTQTFDCQLEIDNDRGVIYVHSTDTGQTILRICRLPAIPIVNLNPHQPSEPMSISYLDITHMFGVSWAKAQSPDYYDEHYA